VHCMQLKLRLTEIEFEPDGAQPVSCACENGAALLHEKVACLWDTIDTVIIQTGDGVPSSFKAAALYLHEQHFPIVRFRRVEELASTVIKQAAFVICGLNEFRSLFPHIVPLCCSDYPPELAGFLGRTVRQCVRHAVVIHEPTFVKPVSRKECGQPGGIATKLSHPVLSQGDANAQIWLSEVVKFANECRVFVAFDAVVGMAPYVSWLEGPSCPPYELMCDMVKAMEGAAMKPVAYCLDMGYCPTQQRWLLVEFTDGFCLGGYGLSTKIYLDFLLARWNELFVGNTMPPTPTETKLT
jgi:hypothetical protein